MTKTNDMGSIPIAAVYSPKNLNNNFCDPHIMPMINIYQGDRDYPNLDYNQANLDAVAILIETRVDINTEILRNLADGNSPLY